MSESEFEKWLQAKWPQVECSNPMYVQNYHRRTGARMAYKKCEMESWDNAHLIATNIGVVREFKDFLFDKLMNSIDCSETLKAIQDFKEFIKDYEGKGGE